MDEQFTHLEPTLEKKLEGHYKGITSLFFSPNEQQIASSSLDNSVLLWDIRGTMKSYRFQGHDEAVLDVTFSSSGKYMASASRDKTVRLWVPTVTGSTGMFKAHSQTVRSVQFSPDSSKIITASDDKIVKLWSTTKLKFISSFVGHTNWVRCARMSGDGSVIASCSDDKTTKLWNPDSGECIYTFKDQKSSGLHLAWHPSSCYIAVGTSNGNVMLYDIRTHNLVQYYSIHNEAVNYLAFHPSGSYILTGSKDGKMKILDLLEGHPIFTLSGHTGPVNSVNFSSSGEIFASGGEDKLIFVWKTNFTELASDIKENLGQDQTPMQRIQTLGTGKKQGMRVWYLCYHSTKYPVVSFVHLDDDIGNQSVKITSLEEPNANSTILNSGHSHRPYVRIVPSTSSLGTGINQIDGNLSGWAPDHHSSHDVGHMSHIPRKPPCPTTYTIPSLNQSVATVHNDEEDLFGMIKLRDNDVCYTSGSIEWVGRKRSYPINSGFKIINESSRQGNEASLKRVKRLDKTFTIHSDKIKDCDCADVLPTVNAIVDHLNALHEAVDIVDLRLNNLEGVVAKI